MNKKIWFIILIVVFIAIILVINLFLNKETEKQTLQDNKEINNLEKEENKMEIIKITGENFESEVLKSDKKVLIDFYADWCGPCKMLSPVVEEVANENSDIKVVKVNIDDNQDLAMKYQVMSIPTLIVIENGKEINKSVGFISKEKVLELIGK